MFDAICLQGEVFLPDKILDAKYSEFFLNFMCREHIRSKVNIIWNILILIAFYEQPYLQVKYKNNGISGLLYKIKC